MIGVMETDASLERILVSWLEPKFRPTALRLTFLCAEPMDYTDRKATTYDVLNVTHIQVYGMKPGTKCVVTLLATYNPANVNDQGMQRRVAVPSTSKYTLVSNCKHFKRVCEATLCTASKTFNLATLVCIKFIFVEYSCSWGN